VLVVSEQLRVSAKVLVYWEWVSLFLYFWVCVSLLTRMVYPLYVLVFAGQLCVSACVLVY
jgi:hypothetical protein